MIEGFGSLGTLSSEKRLERIWGDKSVIAIFATLMILESAHLVSPILLAWQRCELRQIVQKEWVRHILLPAAILPACVLVPQAWVFGLYYAWNIHHFGMQNFGVWQLFGAKTTADGRVRRALICLVATTLGMAVMPVLWPTIYGFILGTIVFSLNHWLVDIFLSSRASVKRWHFLLAVLTIAAVYTLARQGPLSVHVLPQILVIRSGIGFIHFIYSARIWRMHDPRIRALTSSPPFMAGVPSRG